MSKNILIIIASVILNFLLGTSLLFVVVFSYIFITGCGADVGEEMPFLYIPLGFMIIINYISLLVLPNRYLYKKNVNSKIIYTTSSLIFFVIGIAVSKFFLLNN